MAALKREPMALPMVGRKRHCLSLEDKMKVLKAIDEGGDKKSILARKFGISKSTLSTIIVNREKIESAFTTSKFQPSRKRLRTGKFSELEDELFTWFEQERSVGVPIADAVLERKAKELAQDMELEDFTASSGWLNRFKERRGIVKHRNPALTGARKRKKMNKYPTKITGDNEGSGPEETDMFLAEFMSWADSTNWTDAVLPDLLRNHSPSHIFCITETGLFFKCLPFDGKSLKSESCASGELAYERLTVLAAVNLDGSRKLPLLCVGKERNPKCLRNISNLPVNYRVNDRAWMTPQLFSDWLRELDRQFVREDNKVVMLVDTSPAHCNPSGLQAIELVFLPPHTTRNFQSNDKGIVYSLKRNYREIMLKKLIMHLEGHTSGSGEGRTNSESNQSVDFHLELSPQNQISSHGQNTVSPRVNEPLPGSFTWTLLDALHGLRRAWENVSPEVVRNSFAETGFLLPRGDVMITGVSPGGTASRLHYKSLYHRLRSLASVDLMAGEYINVDRRVVTWDQLDVMNRIITNNCSSLTLANNTSGSSCGLDFSYSSSLQSGGTNPHLHNIGQTPNSAFAPPVTSTGMISSVYGAPMSLSNSDVNVYGQSIASSSAGSVYNSAYHANAVGPFCSSTLPENSTGVGAGYGTPVPGSGSGANGCYNPVLSSPGSGPGMGYGSSYSNNVGPKPSATASSVPCDDSGLCVNNHMPQALDLASGSSARATGNHVGSSSAPTGPLRKLSQGPARSKFQKPPFLLRHSTEMDTTTLTPTVAQAKTGVSLLRRFIETKCTDSSEAMSLFQSLGAIEDFIEKVVFTAPRQSSILDYFGKV